MRKLGLDVGGTAIKYGECNEAGEIIEQFSVPTEADKGADHVMQRIIACARELLQRSDDPSQVLGVAFPAVMHNGVSYNCPNMPGFHERPVQQELEQALGCQIVIENDANAAALAEARYGKGRDHQDFLYVTLGTGVGGGVIRNHKVERGPFGDAGEVGHIYVDDRVMEAHVGAPALRVAAGGRDVHEINVAAEAGDPESIKILKAAGEMLGRGLCSALATLGLRVVLLGGGVSKSDILVDTARNTIRAKAIPSIAAAATVSRAKFVHNTGIIGACLLVDNHTRA